MAGKCDPTDETGLEGNTLQSDHDALYLEAAPHRFSSAETTAPQDQPHDLELRAQAGEAEAMVQLALRYREGLGLPRDDRKAFEWFSAAAALNHIRGMQQLGRCLEAGRGVVTDFAAALRWYRAAADKGDAAAQCDLGWAYALGTGVERNDVTAFGWWNKGAEQGHLDSMVAVGLGYKWGTGCPKNATKAAKWLTLAAEKGSGSAMVNLGKLCQEGMGVPQSDTDGARWYERATKQNYGPGFYQLGLCCKEGRGMRQNELEGVVWFQKGANLGDDDCCNALGEFHAFNFRVPRDYPLAMRWWRQAAGNNHGRAQYNLGVAYRDGKIVMGDDGLAYYWLGLAFDAGHYNDARYARSALEKRLSPDRVAELDQCIKSRIPPSPCNPA